MGTEGEGGGGHLRPRLGHGRRDVGRCLGVACRQQHACVAQHIQLGSQLGSMQTGAAPVHCMSGCLPLQ